jgi:KipI family sensor histidine kinase inhibitor
VNASRSAATPRIREAGDSALLIELEPVIDERVNARAVRMAHAVSDASIPGVRDVTPTYRTVAVYFDPLVVSAERLEQALTPLCDVDDEGPLPGRLVEVPVAYGGDAGADLVHVAAWSGLTAEEVIRRHMEPTYRVFMLGFLPGFAYLGSVDPAIAAPRRETPRLKVPGGAVAIAGRQTGVYPRESPGGWNLIGRTRMSMFDVTRSPASTLAPGDRVRFVADDVDPWSASAEEQPFVPAAPDDGRAVVTVLEPGLMTTIQDLGRWGAQATGVSPSGAMDPVAHRAANALAGNRLEAATLESTLVGPALRFETDATVAIAGADLSASVNGTPLPSGTTLRVMAGSALRFGERRSGARAYIACAGGFDVPPVVGSRATHLSSRYGGLQGRMLRAGDRLHIGHDVGEPSPGRMARHSVIGASGGRRLRILPGPQSEFFSAEALAALQAGRYVITPQSNRMGYRLSGPALPGAGREMISDATFTGAVQVPASGQPILLMADRQTVGGYPQLAIVISADVPLAGQLAPGDWIEFVLCDRADALAALAAQRQALPS